MLIYLLKRLGLFLPTLLIILTINFLIVQTAPTGPLQTKLEAIKTEQTDFLQNHQKITTKNDLPIEFLNQLNHQFGFDKPLHERYFLMLRDYARFDLGDSFFKGQSVSQLIAQKLPISLLFGGLSLMVMYGLGVFFGVLKAYFDGLFFDKVTAIILAFFYAIPTFVLALALIVVFAGFRFWHIFPMQAVLADVFRSLSFFLQIKTIIYYFTLPVIASSLSGMASIAYLTKFSLMTEKHSAYSRLATAQGLGKWQIFYHHLIKNASLPILAEMPMTVAGVLFSGNFLVEVIFGIDGIGRLAYEAAMMKDYPVMFGILYVFTLFGMAVQLIFDILYHQIDPKVDYR